jgi:predicted aspartyl protease
MTYSYDNQRYNPAAPVLPIIVHIPGDSTRQVKTVALMDTGADITCLPKALIDALGAEPASRYDVFGINGKFIGSPESYFLEFEIAGTKKLIEVIDVSDDPILGRNLINEFTLKLYGPSQKLDITSGLE